MSTKRKVFLAIAILLIAVFMFMATEKAILISEAYNKNQETHQYSGFEHLTIRIYYDSITGKFTDIHTKTIYPNKQSILNIHSTDLWELITVIHIRQDLEDFYFKRPSE